MDLNSIKILEFDKIVNILSKFACTYIGKEKCLTLLPTNDIDAITNLQNQTNEAIRFIQKKGSISISEIDDITISLKKVKSGFTLSAKEILCIGKVLKTSSDLKKYFFKDFEDVDISFAKNIEIYFSNLYLNKDLENTIFNSIIDEHTLSDTASNELYTIRRKKLDLESKIRDKLNSIISSSTYSNYLQDNIITIKNGRFVIPVKQEYKSNFSGLVHDISSSGSTLFIEPNSVFEINNSIRELQILEELEIEKILSNISLEISKISDNILSNLNTIGEIDFIFAKAKYALNLKASQPMLNKDKIINLKNARHPLINQDIVVPINISIGKNYNSLVITGPNTGGKTVTLKTVRSFNINGL